MNAQICPGCGERFCPDISADMDGSLCPACEDKIRDVDIACVLPSCAQSTLIDLLDRERVIAAIECEPEYPDDKDFLKQCSTAIMLFPGVSKQLADAFSALVLDCARIAVRETKKRIRERVMKL